MKKSTMSAVAAVCVAGALAVSLGAVSDWYTNWDTSTWFGRGGGQSTVQPDDPNKPDVGYDTGHDGAIITVGGGNGIRLTSAKLPVSAYAANGVSQYADTAYILTATITPSDATNTALDWSVAFVDPDSEWATGKTVTDYVTVTKSTSGNTATVECKQAFGEQVIVKCVSLDNPDAYATCTVDYSVKVLSSVFGGSHVSGIGAPNFSSDKTNLGSVCGVLNVGTMYAFYANPTLSLGTLGNSFTREITFIPTSDIMGYLPGHVAHSVAIEHNKTKWVDEALINAMFGSGVYGTSAFYGACSNTVTSTAIRVDVKYASDYVDYSYTYYLRINPDTVKVCVGDVELDNDSIIF